MIEPLAVTYIGVGSNILPEENVRRALELLSQNENLKVVGISTVYRTAALRDPAETAGLSTEGPTRGDPDFLNGVVSAHTSLSPAQLLASFSEIEETLGRARDRYDKFAPRTMDLDLLLYGHLSDHPSDPDWKEIGPDGLYVHKDLETRSFVAFPLLELAPNLIIPPYRIPLIAITNSFDTVGGTPELELTKELRERFLSS